MMSRLAQLVFVVCLALMPGCAWYRGWSRAPQSPTVFPGPPSLAQVGDHINSHRIRQLEAEQARISVDGLPSLGARLAIETPRNLRFRVETGLTGAEMDVGSNADMFWMWIKRNDAVFYSRHDTFAGSAARQMIPVQPEWIAEALGVMYFDPQGKHEGPFDRGNNRLEIRTKLMAADGELTRVLMVHSTYGWILEQHLYDPRGQLIASARNSNHRYYPVEGVSLPHRLEINLPPAQLAFALDVAQYRINSLSSSPQQLFTMPSFGDSQLVDVSDPRFALPPPQAQTPPGGATSRWDGSQRSGALPVRGMRR